MSAPVIDQSPVQINFRPTTATARRVVSVALSVPAIGAAIAVVAFVVIAVQRIWYPYELDWLESGMLEHVRRLVDGQPLYTAPSATFTQYPYTPVSFGVGALFSEIFGVHYSVMRGISFVSTLGTFALIFWMVRKETKSAWASFIAVGVYAGTYKLSATWFDVGKADSLFLFITLGAIAVARVATTKKAGALAGFLMAAAVMTKQTAIFAFVPVAIYLLATRRQAGIAFTISSLVFGGGTTLLLNIVSHGWFDYYVWELLFQQPMISTSRWDFFTYDMFPFWPAVVITLLALPQLFAKEKRWATGFYVFALSGLVAGAWSSRLHSGGAFNVLIPAFATAAIAVGISLGTILEKPRRIALILGAVIVCCAQLWFVRYDPTQNTVPSALDRQTGDNFINWLKTVNGNVFIYSHPTYAVMAGKADYASQGGSEDVLRGKTLHAKADFERSIANAIHNDYFAAIILDGPDDTRGFPADWQSYYTKLPGSAVTNDSAWRPITLVTGHPVDVYVPVGTHNIALPLPGGPTP